MIEFASAITPTVTPYRAAMALSVSPATTTWTRAVGAGDGRAGVPREEPNEAVDAGAVGCWIGALLANTTIEAAGLVAPRPARPPLLPRRPGPIPRGMA